MTLLHDPDLMNIEKEFATEQNVDILDEEEEDQDETDNLIKDSN